MGEVSVCRRLGIGEEGGGRYKATWKREYEGRCKATWKRKFKLPWWTGARPVYQIIWMIKWIRMGEAGPPNHLDDEVDSDQ